MENPFVQAGALSSDWGEILRSSPYPNFFDQAGAINGGVDQLKDSCRFIPLCHILKATNDFDDALVTGTGGFGKVYKGSIDDGATTTVVTIKRLSKSALSSDDSTKPRSLPDFDATENKAARVYTRQGRGCWDSMGFEQRTTLEELGMDLENEGIISDLLRFVRDKEELYKEAGKDWKKGYLLCDSPGTDRSSLIAAMAKFLEFDIYDLDLTGLTSISELTNVLVSIRNRSLIAIKDFDSWFAMLPNLKNELMLSGLLKIIHGLLSSCGDEQIIVLTTNHIDRVDVALLRPLNIDLYVHTSSPQLKALPDGGEIVLLDSSEHKPSVDFYATNNRAYQSDVHVSNSEEKNMREASRRQYMPERVLSLVDSTARISSTDFDASDNRAHFVRAYQSGPLVFNSEKKDTGEGLSRECLTKSVLSLDDSSKQKSLSDDAVTEKKSHLVIGYQSGPIVSLSNDKNRGEPLKRECFNKSIFGIDDLQQHSGGRRDDAAKSFCETRIIHIFSSSKQQAFDATNVHLVKADERGPTVSSSEKGCTREALKRDCLTNALSLEDLQQHFGARRKDAVKVLCDSPAWKSIEVLDSLPLGERSNNIRHLTRQRALMHKHCVRLKKSQDLLQSLQRDWSGGLASQSDIGLPDGEHILSLLKKKIVRKTLKKKGRTMSVLSLEDHQQHFGRRWEDAVKFLGSKRICRQLAIHSGTTAKHIRRQLGTHRWPFKQSAIGFPDGGNILSLSEKKIVRKTLKRKCRNTSVLRLEDHEQHVDRWREDAAKSHGTKRICRQLGIHRFSTAKRTHKQHGIHQWPFQRSAICVPDRGHILSLSEKKIVRKTLKRKCRSTSVLSLVDRQQHVDRRWEDAAKNIGAKRICRQLVIHRVSIVKRICRQHGIHHRWPFELDRVTMKGYTLGDERPVEVIRLSTDGKLVSRLQVIYISWLGRFSPPPSTLPRGEIVGHIALSSSQFGTTNSIAQRVGQDQSGSASSDSENERTREQENPKKIYTSITKDDLLRRMHKMNREDAATSLNISVATFKRKCREFGIQRWPHVRKEKVGRPPDQHGERNTSTACKMPLHNVHARMEGEPVGQNQEANEFRPYFMEHSIALSTENDSIIAVYSETEAARGSSEWTFQLEGQTMQSTTYPYRDDPVFSQSQIASTEVVNENMGSLQDRRDLLASQVVAPQKEPLLERHVFGFGNWTVGSCSDLASSQTMRTFSHPTGSLENLKNWLASVEEHLMEENVYAVGDGDGDERRAPVEEGRTPVAAGPEGLQVRQLDPISGVEGLVITGLGSLGAGSSGSGGGDGGDGPRTPPRDPARGKGPVVEEGVSREVPAEEIEFRSAVGSSAHVPITRGDFAEFVTEEELGRLFRENPRVVTAVIQAREDRQRQVERAQEEERLRAEAERAAVEGEAFVREAEAAEQVPEEGGQAQERAVAVADARRRAPRAEFVAETYVPPEPHLFVPSGVDSYLPRQKSYDAELVLRDPERHLSVAWAQRGTASTRGHGSPTHSLELYKKLPERVRALVDAAGFRPFILTLTVIKSDHALLTALAERWWDSSNTFHLPIGEMTVTPADFAALTGLRVGGEAIPFDSGIHEDEAALRWFLGRVPEGSSEMVPHNQFHRYLTRRVPSSVQEEEQMARAYLLYLFGATLYPNKRATVHLSYLPALRDLQTVSRYDWGGAALGACYSFMGEFSRGKKAVAGYWRVWELWAYEVLKMYPPENTCPDLRMLPRALIWGPMYRGKKKSRGSLLAFRVYLDELSGTQVEWDPWRNSEPEPEYLAQSRVVAASRVLLESAFGWQWYLGDRVTRQSLDSSEFVTPGPLPPRASHTGQYTLAELQRFTVPADLTAFLRTERNYAIYRRQHLARPLGVMEHGAVESEAREAGEERRGRSNGVFRSRERSGYATAIGLPRLSWTLAVRDAQGDEATVRFEPARTEPAEITGPAPMEWVREAVRLMKAMEKEFHKIAGGASLQLHYPPPVAAPVLQPQGQPRAAPRRKSVRPPPQKKVAERTSRVAERTQRGVEIVSPSDEPQFHRELRKRPAEKRPAEGPLQKRRREEEEEEEEEEEQQQQSSFSIGSDSASDPRFWVDPWEVEDTNDDDDDLEDLFDD